jgi:CheY-like chemotaxis protein
LIQIKNTVAPGHLGPEGLETDVMAQRSVVVVVDDDPSLLKSVARLLAHHGIDSRTFASAEALLESDCFEAATCLPLDINLGGISGIELQRRLVASGSKLPTILMTAKTTKRHAMKRWTPDASPICESRSRSMSCWTPARKLRLSPRNQNTRDGRLRSGPFRQSRPFHLVRVALKIGGIPVLFNGPYVDDLAARLLGTAEPDGFAARTVAGLFRELTLCGRKRGFARPNQALRNGPGTLILPTPKRARSKGLQRAPGRRRDQ